MEKAIISRKKVLEEKKYYTQKYKDTLIEMANENMKRLEFITDARPTYITREDWEGKLVLWEVFIYEYENGDKEEYESKEEYIKYIFEPVIADCNSDLKHCQERLLHLEYLLEYKCNDEN